MKDSAIDDAFYKQLQRDIDKIDEKADLYRAIYYGLRILLIFLASIITVISGWGGNAENPCILNIILVLGASSTAATALDTLFQVETKKNTYRLMLVELRDLRSEFVFYYHHQRTDLEIALKEKIFPKYQAIKAISKTLLENENENEAAKKAT